MRPGEVSLAHRGVLFLDELGEFPAVVLDQLRQPLEEGVVRICRAETRVTMPAAFQLVAAMNPCPCGAPDGPGSCRCSDGARQRYTRRVSGPLLDRFDLRLTLARADSDDVLRGPPGEATAPVAERVAAVRDRSEQRGVRANSLLSRAQLDVHGPLDRQAENLLQQALRHGLLSARGLRRVRCVARTVADLDGCGTTIEARHVAAALQLRGEPSFTQHRMGV